MRKSIPKNKMSTINNNKNEFDAHNLEHLNKILTYNQKSVRIFGTNEDPWFCGRDVCEILEYENYRKALMVHIKEDCKKNLKELRAPKVGTHKIHYNEERLIYINEEGLYNLIFACKLPNAKPLKVCMDQFFYDLRYKSGIMDIFTFMKNKKIEIDMNSPWF